MPTPPEIKLKDRNRVFVERLNTILTEDRNRQNEKHKRERSISFFKGYVTGMVVTVIIAVVVGLTAKDPLTKYYHHLTGTGGKTPHVTKN